MTAVQTAQTMTAEEFLELPVPEHGRPWNLVEGEVVMNYPTWMHGKVNTRLIVAVDAWIREGTARGDVVVPIAVKLDDRNVYAPDLLWYGHGQAPRWRDKGPYPMPAVAAEVRSPSTWRYDVGAKKAGYERRGLPELWLVDTAADVVLVFRRSAPGAPSFDVAVELGVGDVLESPLMPGFTLALSALFAE